jgi:hypothetical protein
MVHHEYFAGADSDLCSFYLNVLARVRQPVLWWEDRTKTLCLHTPYGVIKRRHDANYGTDLAEAVQKGELEPFNGLFFFAIDVRGSTGPTDPRDPATHALLRQWFWRTQTLVLRTGPLASTQEPVFSMNYPGDSFSALIWLVRRLEITRKAIATLVYGHTKVSPWRPFPSDVWVLGEAVFEAFEGGPGVRGRAHALWLEWCAQLRKGIEPSPRERLRFAATGPARIDAILDPDVAYVDAAFGTAAMLQLASSSSTVDKWLVAWDSALRGWKVAFPFDALFLSFKTTRIIPEDDEFRQPQAIMAAMSVVLAVCHQAWLEALEWSSSGSTHAHWHAHEAVRQFFYSQALLTEPTRARAWKFAHTRKTGAYPLGRWQFGVVLRNAVRATVDRLSEDATLREYATGLEPIARLQADILSAATRLWAQAGRFAQPETKDNTGPLWLHSVHLRTRVDALRQPSYVVGLGEERPITSAAFSLRNWTLEQNLEYLNPIIETLAVNPGFVSRVRDVVQSVEPYVDELNRRSRDRRKPEYYKVMSFDQTREPRETPLLSPSTPKTQQDWAALGVFFFKSLANLDTYFGNPETTLRLGELDVTHPNFWHQKSTSLSETLSVLVGKHELGAFEPLEGTLRLVVWRPAPGCPAYTVAAALKSGLRDIEITQAHRRLLRVVRSLGLGPRLLEYVPSQWQSLTHELAFHPLARWHQRLHPGAVKVLPTTQPSKRGLYRLSHSSSDGFAFGLWKELEIRRVDGGIVIDLMFPDASNPGLVLDVIFTVRALCPYAVLSLYFGNGGENFRAQDWCWQPVARPALQVARANGTYEVHTRKLELWATGLLPNLAAAAQV